MRVALSRLLSKKMVEKVANGEWALPAGTYTDPIYANQAQGVPEYQEPLDMGIIPEHWFEEDHL